VYIGGGDNFAYALDAATGQELWRFDAGSDIQSAPIVTERGILVTTIDGTLSQVSGSSGDRNWWFETGMTITHAPGASDWMVFLATEDGMMFALQSSDGMELWRMTTHYYGFTMPPVVFDDVVYVGVSGEGLYAVDAETAEGYWPITSESRTLGGDIWAESAVAADGVLFVGGTGAVYAFSTARGYELWGYRTYASVSSPPVVHRGTVYVVDEGGRVFALDAATGAEHWVFDTGQPITSSPVVAGNIVYVSSWDGAVYAFPAVPPPIASGMAAIVVIDTPLRAEPGLAGEEIATLTVGTQVYISGDSVWGDETYWWPVIAPDGSTGWVDGLTLRGEY
jgi:outer membrane protein assembly factor BamB